MVCEFDYEFGGHVVSGGLREVVDDDRERRPVCYRTIESEQARGGHLLFVIKRRGERCPGVSCHGWVLGELQRFMWSHERVTRDRNVSVGDVRPRPRARL